jgi:FkbM family methyltransferase
MTILKEAFPRNEIRHIRGGGMVRALNRFLPLGRKYHPLLRLLNGRHGLLLVPFDKYHVIEPAAWSKAIATHLVMNTDTVAEFQVLKPLCQQCPAGHLIDVGANLGLFTLSLRAASALPIIAYEPQPFLFKLLEWNIAYNELFGIEARNLACGHRRGEIAFSTGLNGSIVTGSSVKTGISGDAAGKPTDDWVTEALNTQAGGIVNVPMTTLDEDLAQLEKIALLKIDCEGFEFQILQGAKALLQRHRPFLFVEVHPEQLVQFGHSTRELLDLITPDYELEFWYFQIGRHASRFSRSLEKFRRPKARRCASVEEMLAASTSVPGPAQIYFLGRPK